MDTKTFQKAEECRTNINNAKNIIEGINNALKDNELFALEFHIKNGRHVRILGNYDGEQRRHDAMNITPQLRKYLEAEKTRLMAELETAELEFENL